MAFINSEQVKVMRNKIKELFPSKDGWKISVKKEHHSSVLVHILSAPIDLLNEHNGERSNFPVNHYHLDSFKNKEIFQKITDVCMEGNYDHSDSMTDYFNVGWYFSLHVGKWDIPFTVTEPKKKNKFTKDKPVESKLDWQAAEIKTVYTVKHKPSEKITRSEDIYKYIKPIFESQEQHVEQFNVFYMNTANKVIGWKHIGTGGVSGVVADIRVIMKHALDIMATAIILSHNHPSGNKKASQQDIQLTNKVKEAAKLFDMQVLDHIIICEDEYFSFADEGNL